MKRLMALLVAAVMALGVLSGCSGGEGTSSTGNSGAADSSGGGSSGAKYAFMSKKSGSTFTDHMWYGFKTAIEAIDPGAEVLDRSPSEGGATYQLTAMDELLTQNITGLCMATWAETGFDEMNQKYKDAGIPIVSIDSRVADDTRVTHFNQTDSDLLGQYYLWTSILATVGYDFTDADDAAAVEAEAKKVVEEHTGDPIIVGLISATPDSPVQLAWHASIDAELEDPIYAGKVEQDIKYGMDEQTEAANQLNAFLTEGKVDVVFCMSAFSATVSQAAADANAQIPVVGLDLCSNAYDVLPNEGDDTYSAVMPFAVLWDLQLQGFVAANGLYQTCEGNFDGSEGSTFTTVAVDRFEEKEYTAVDCPMDDGTEVICGEPLIFTKYNKDTWRDRV